MKFLIDAQLPRKLAVWVRDRGHDVCHTLDLPEQNRTSDAQICAFATQEGRIVVTKDDDFVQSFVLNGQPPRLLLVATGNISNEELLTLWQDRISSIETAFDSARFVEINRSAMIVHE
ncbi:MAG: DUF5615 family PIN-like protein [Rhodocyclaceae bacterium]